MCAYKVDGFTKPNIEMELITLSKKFPNNEDAKNILSINERLDGDYTYFPPISVQQNNQPISQLADNNEVKSQEKPIQILKNDKPKAVSTNYKLSYYRNEALSRLIGQLSHIYLKDDDKSAQNKNRIEQVLNWCIHNASSNQK